MLELALPTFSIITRKYLGNTSIKLYKIVLKIKKIVKKIKHLLKLT